MIFFNDFKRINIRVGQIVEVKEFPEARKPSYKIKVDLGSEIGIKSSCSQLTKNYKPGDLLNKKVLCVVNLPAFQIGPAISEVLVLGVRDKVGECVLVVPDKAVEAGGRLY